MNKTKLKYLLVSGFGKIITGKTPKTSIKEYWGGKVPFITPTDIPTFDTRYLLKTERTISQKGVDAQKNTLLPVNSICISCIATIGKVCLTRIPSITNQQINSIIVDKKYNPMYLLYVFRYYQPYLQLIAGGTGSGTPIINKNKFSNLKYPIYENINIQSNIARILENYDSLIENNNRRIKLLETMAEELYKEWFVRFRFPGYKKFKFKNSNLGKIPLNFNVIKIKDVLDYYIGGGWGNENETEEFSIGAYVVRGTDFPYVKIGDVSTCPYRYHKKSNYKPRQLKENDIILEISGGTSEQPVGRTIIITKGVVEQVKGELICASFCKLLRAKQETISSNYLYYWLQYLYNTRIIERFQLQSTGIINFKFEYFYNKGDVLMPSTELIKQFDDYVIPIKDEIDKLSIKNKYLIQQRDYLFPRLMSGKLSVENKNII